MAKDPIFEPLPLGISLRPFWTRWNRRVDFCVVDARFNQSMAIAKPLEFVDIAEGADLPTSFSLSTEAAQRLFEHLWWLGFRPQEQLDSQQNEGTIASQKEHIADLRNMVMRLGDKFLK